jgi:hypothetical protein
MTIQVKCRGCGRSYRLRDDLAGRRLKCKDCGKAMQVPAADDDQFEDEFEGLPPATRRKSPQRGTSRAAKRKPRRHSQTSQIDTTVVLMGILCLLHSAGSVAWTFRYGSVLLNSSFLFTFGGIFILARIAGDIGLFSGGIGILARKQWGVSTAQMSSLVLVGVLAISFLRSLGALFSSFGLKFLGSMLGSVAGYAAVPVVILIWSSNTPDIER